MHNTLTRLFLILILLFCCASKGLGNEYSSEIAFDKEKLQRDSMAYDPHIKKRFSISYRVDSISVDPGYMNNAERLDSMRLFLRVINNNPFLQLDSVKFSGTASPEGYYEFNNWLSENRLEKLKNIMREEIEIPDSIIYGNDAYITWQRLRNAVASSNLQHKDTVLAILDMEPGLIDWYKIQPTGKRMRTDHRMFKIRQLYGGKVYNDLKPILDSLRYADVDLIVRRPLLAQPVPYELFVPQLQFSSDMSYMDLPIYEDLLWRMYIKTNFIKWALGITNVAVEVDLARHWTYEIAGFYSKWDYIKSTIKFRFGGFQTGVRYWFNPYENDGWFLGAHFGFSYYNLAFNGKHRYQDLYGKTPTKGGGIEAGWRKQFGYKNRWRLEFSLGAGVYPLDYSVFHNTPDYKEGQWIERRKKTFFGIDQASVSIGYAIDICNKRKLKGVEFLCNP